MLGCVACAKRQICAEAGWAGAATRMWWKREGLVGWGRGVVGGWGEFPVSDGRMCGCVEGSGGESGVGGGVGSAKNALMGE